MPELPEVETVALDLRNAPILGVAIRNVEIFWEKIITCSFSQDFIDLLRGQKIVNVSRRAKYLIFSLRNGNSLVVHLRMTGKVLVKPALTSRLPHEHLIITFENGVALHYHDTRKFGRWVLVEDAENFLKHIGPEPLEKTFSEKDFKTRLRNSKRQLKPLLLDQSFIAGLGNIYVDEALWEAKLHPQMHANQVSDKHAGVLFKAIRLVLERGLEARGTTLGSGKSNFYLPNGKKGEHQTKLQVFRRTGLPCFRCQFPIVRLIVGQRSTHICPNCQNAL